MCQVIRTCDLFSLTRSQRHETPLGFQSCETLMLCPVELQVGQRFSRKWCNIFHLTWLSGLVFPTEGLKFFFDILLPLVIKEHLKEGSLLTSKETTQFREVMRPPARRPLLRVNSVFKWQIRRAGLALLWTRSRVLSVFRLVEFKAAVLCNVWIGTHSKIGTGLS